MGSISQGGVQYFSIAKLKLRTPDALSFNLLDIQKQQSQSCWLSYNMSGWRMLAQVRERVEV
jgi:hypothetical protein